MDYHNYVVGSHGVHTGKFITLPKNVRVIMICPSISMDVCEQNDARIWLATLSEINPDLSINISFFDSKTKKYVFEKKSFTSLASQLKDKYCVYSGNIPEMRVCPNLALAPEEKKFRSGIFKTPATLLQVFNKNIKVGTTQYMKGQKIKLNNGYIVRNLYNYMNKSLKLNSIISAIMFPEREKNYNIVYDEKSYESITHSSTLGDVISKIKKKHDNTSFVTVFLFACKSFSSSLPQEIKQYSELSETKVDVNSYSLALQYVDIATGETIAKSVNILLKKISDIQQNIQFIQGEIKELNDTRNFLSSEEGVDTTSLEQEIKEKETYIETLNQTVSLLQKQLDKEKRSQVIQHGGSTNNYKTKYLKYKKKYKNLTNKSQ